MCLFYFLLSLRRFGPTRRFKWFDCQSINCTERELIVILDNMRAKFIDIFVVIHFVHDCMEPLRTEMLVKKHAEKQGLLLILDLDQFKLHSLYECELFLLIRAKQSLKLLGSLPFTTSFLRHYEY